MAKNTRYARLAENNSIEYSPRTFKEGGEIIVPRVDDDEAYFSRGWYLVVDVVPEYDHQTQYVKSKTWVVIQSIHTINAQYEIDDIPQEEKVKRYSKLKLTLFCMQQNLWADVKAFLEQIGYYDLYSDFGLTLGDHPRIVDEELNSLSVAILPLPGGEFYHYGTSRELISSTITLPERF